jgi:NADH:ubiquinone oxidoreductase subunit 5 (subunit L)/multisubunit Na+/H+ antiporter MnhA subunit
VQHDLKKLLAYHSIENIGIIGIGIGLGCIGLGEKNNWMSVLGFTGALLHTLNHSLFKSLLFFSTGSVLQAFHTVNVERLGGLIRKLPHTTLIFLVSAVAICGLPPLNGFISEFLIYGGLYNWLYSASLMSLIAIAFSLVGLVLIGGLAILCFTKAFSVVFLGTPRHITENTAKVEGFWRLLPMYLSMTLMMVIGLFPSFFVSVLQKPAYLFTKGVVFNLDHIRVGAIDSLMTINWMFMGFILLVLLLSGLRRLAGGKRPVESSVTWGCGYTGDTGRMQYTANSFVRSYAKLAKPILDIAKKEVEIGETFPAGKEYETHPSDKIERLLIDKPVGFMSRLGDLFLFLQNGQLQSYILYGIIFISAVLTLPVIISSIVSVLHFINNL